MSLAPVPHPEPTPDLTGLEQNLQERFSDRGRFEGFLLEQQTSLDEPNLVKRVIALHGVKASVSLTSEAADGLVRAELKDGSRVNWRFYYLKEEGCRVPPFENFWLEPVEGASLNPR